MNQTAVPVFNVRDFGAVGDGVTYETPAIQAAIDKCNADGGGRVHFPNGNYLTGTLFLKSNVELNLEVSATILGSTDLKDYSKDVARCGFVNEVHIDPVLIFAGNVENIAITGRGTIDGQGAAFVRFLEDGTRGDRPMLIRCYRSQNIRIENLTLKHSGAWCTHFRECFDIRCHGVTIQNRVNENNDGFDFMSSSRVRVSDCNIFCLDDAICFQPLSDDYPCEDIVITNCIMSTRWAAIRSGGASKGGIRNITVSNCVIKDTYGCGIKLQASGNSDMENITFSNIVMQNVSCPISVRFGNCHYNNDKFNESQPWGRTRNIMFNNIWASVVDEETLKREVVFPELYPNEERQCMSFCGIPEHPVEGITLSDIHISYPGGGTLEDAANVNSPEHENQYPEYFMWGVLPAYGLYARHATGLCLDNVRFELRSKDLRPAVLLDDVIDCDISQFRADLDDSVDSLIKTRDTKQIFVGTTRVLGKEESPKPAVTTFE